MKAISDHLERAADSRYIADIESCPGLLMQSSFNLTNIKPGAVSWGQITGKESYQQTSKLPLDGHKHVGYGRDEPVNDHQL